MMTDVATPDKRFDRCGVPWPEGAAIAQEADRLRAYRIIRDLQSPKSDWPTIQARLDAMAAPIAAAAVAYGRDRTMLSALIAAESEGDPAADSGSASGLMQITRLTWEDMRNRHARFRDTVYDRDRYDPQINLAVGAALLADMERRILRETAESNVAAILLCMAYNAGPGVVVRYLRRAGTGHRDGFPLRDLALANLDKAIKETNTYIYYTVCNGARVNPYIDGAAVSDEADRFAVLLKTAEVYYFLERIECFRAALSNTG